MVPTITEHNSGVNVVTSCSLHTGLEGDKVTYEDYKILISAVLFYRWSDHKQFERNIYIGKHSAWNCKKKKMCWSTLEKLFECINSSESVLKLPQIYKQQDIFDNYIFYYVFDAKIKALSS